LLRFAAFAVNEAFPKPTVARGQVWRTLAKICGFRDRLNRFAMSLQECRASFAKRRQSRELRAKFRDAGTGA